MQCFYIHKNATLPTLRLELILDGKYDFFKSYHFNNAIQNADVTFSMWDEHDVLKIADAPCDIILSKDDTCVDRYIIEYKWRERDTRKIGHFKGKIKINFKSDLYESGVTYDGGTFIGPIYEDLDIFIKD
jgi:hypothetical protein